MAGLDELLPGDEHDRTLVENVHPPTWTDPEPPPRYNLIAVGGGTAGLVCAAGAATLGARAALVEREFLGGDCLVTGCVPSKALIRSGHAVAAVREATRFGVAASLASVDFEAVMRRVRAVRARISENDSARRFSGLGVDVYLGDARFVGRDALEVNGKRLRFSRAVIATGGRPVVPPIDGLERTGYLTNETVFRLTALPRRFLVVGGGPLGVELAQAFARLGSRVTVVELMPRFLPREDPEAAAILARALERDGVELRLGTSVRAVEPTAEGKSVSLERDGGVERLVVDELLIGVGRRPNVEGLALESAGVDYDRQGVRVDDRLRTSNRRIFAAGDVCLAHKFTHAADASARIVLQNALFPGPKKRYSSLVVPWCTYTDPEVAHVGISEAEAVERGIELQTVRVPLDDVDRALADGEEQGFVKIHLRRGTDRILGATIVGRQAGDMLSEISLALVGGIGLGKISSVIHPYPTRAEAIRKAADQFNRTRLSPRIAGLLQRWFSWTR